MIDGSFGSAMFANPLLLHNATNTRHTPVCGYAYGHVVAIIVYQL